MRNFIALAMLVAAISITSCNDTSKPLPVKVSGSVKLDKKPMDEGEIAFLIDGEPPSTISVKSGQYEGTALPGKAKVEIRLYKSVKPKTSGGTAPMAGVEADSKTNVMPARFSSATKLTADVSKDGVNKFDFDVESK